MPTKPSSSSPNIRISSRSKAMLQSLSRKEGKSMQSVLDDAVERYQRDKLLDEINAAYAALRKDPKAWKAELAERALLENSIGDGLENE